MGQRAYRRDSRGRFAGSGGRVTMGKAGGFANASHQAKAQNARQAAAVRRALVQRRVRTAKRVAAVVGVGAVGALAVGSRRAVSRQMDLQRSLAAYGRLSEVLAKAGNQNPTFTRPTANVSKVVIDGLMTSRTFVTSPSGVTSIKTTRLGGSRNTNRVPSFTRRTFVTNRSGVTSIRHSNY